MASGGDDFLGGLFDFDGDGKTDPAEEFLTYQLFEEAIKDPDEFDDDDDLADIVSTDYVPKRVAPDITPTPVRQTQSGTHPLPDRLTLSQYKERRWGFFRECVGAVLLATFLCMLPALLMWAAVNAYDERNSASGFLTTVFVLGGLAVIGVIVVAAISSMVASCQHLQQLKEVYQRSTPQEELERLKKAKKKHAILICTVLVVGLIVLATVSTINSQRLHSTYSEAEALIAQGHYEQAKELLESIQEKNYQDTEALISLCKAHEEYSAGRAIDAYYTMNGVVFNFQSESQKAEILSFRHTLISEYNAYNRKIQERLERINDEAIRNGVPYVGMSESKIGDTSLGAPSDKVRHNGEMINGESYRANLYDFYQNGKLVFTARCVQGKVTKVWDKRDKLQSSYTATGSNSSSSSSGSSVDEYAHPDDFYDWNRDDFVDFEEAEDYYYSHGWK